MRSKACQRLEIRGVLCHDKMMCSESLSVRLLGRRGAENGNVRTHRYRKLHAHMSETAETDDTDLLTRPRPKATERRIRRDAGTHQRGDAREVPYRVIHLQRIALVDHILVRIAAVCRRHAVHVRPAYVNAAPFWQNC